MRISQTSSVSLKLGPLLFLIYIKTSECGLPNDHFGRLTSVTLILIIKKKLGSAQVPKFGKLLVKIDSSNYQKPTKLDKRQDKKSLSRPKAY